MQWVVSEGGELNVKKIILKMPPFFLFGNWIGAAKRYHSIPRRFLFVRTVYIYLLSTAQHFAYLPNASHTKAKSGIAYRIWLKVEKISKKIAN